MKFENHYFMKDLWEEDKWEEINQKFFNDTVIKYRNLFDMKYQGNERIFINKDSRKEEFKIIKYQA